MKKILFFAFCSITFFQLNAQDKQIPYPHLSPIQKIETRVGLVDISLKYSRPSMRGRKIFGGLVPYDKVWRTGANKNTSIVFNDKVIIGDQELEAGTYTIFTKPNINNWEVYFHTELDEYGAPEKLESKNIKAKIIVPTIVLQNTYQSLSITIENLTYSSAEIVIAWENTSVAIPIKIPISKILKKKLSKKRIALADDYRIAAFILFEREHLNDEALDAINQSISVLENGKSFEEWFKNADLKNRHLPYKHLMKSEILAALGQKEKAIATAKTSLMIARKVNDDYYIKENLKNLEEWKK